MFAGGLMVTFGVKQETQAQVEAAANTAVHLLSKDDFKVFFCRHGRLCVCITNIKAIKNFSY